MDRPIFSLEPPYPRTNVLRGMIEAKEMVRELWGTKNVYTYGVAGTGFSGVDCVLSMILPGDKVVVFSNGTFSGIDGLTIRAGDGLAMRRFDCDYVLRLRVQRIRSQILFRGRLHAVYQAKEYLFHDDPRSRLGVR
jgi:aspartate aminotransferase-like enzyme